MELGHAIRHRRSIRKFRPDPIPGDIISEILDIARWAPSWANTQPWEFYVITGDALERYRMANHRKCMDGEEHAPEVPMPEPKTWPERLKQRSKRLGRRVLESLDISREDSKARKAYYGEVFSLFGAPCLIVVCLNRHRPLEYPMLDVGLIMQTFCLLAHEKGLGTCMLAASVRYPDILRKLLSLPEDKVIVLGTALGYPDLESPINHLQRERADLDEFVSWVDGTHPGGG